MRVDRRDSVSSDVTLVEEGKDTIDLSDKKSVGDVLRKYIEDYYKDGVDKDAIKHDMKELLKEDPQEFQNAVKEIHEEDKINGTFLESRLYNIYGDWEIDKNIMEREAKAVQSKQDTQKSIKDGILKAFNTIDSMVPEGKKEKDLLREIFENYNENEILEVKKEFNENQINYLDKVYKDWKQDKVEEVKKEFQEIRTSSEKNKSERVGKVFERYNEDIIKEARKQLDYFTNRDIDLRHKEQKKQENLEKRVDDFLDGRESNLYDIFDKTPKIMVEKLINARSAIIGSKIKEIYFEYEKEKLIKDIKSVLDDPVLENLGKKINIKYIFVNTPKSVVVDAIENRLLKDLSGNEKGIKEDENRLFEEVQAIYEEWKEEMATKGKAAEKKAAAKVEETAEKTAAKVEEMAEKDAVAKGAEAKVEETVEEAAAKVEEMAEKDAVAKGAAAKAANGDQKSVDGVRLVTAEPKVKNLEGKIKGNAYYNRALEAREKVVMEKEMVDIFKKITEKGNEDKYFGAIEKGSKVNIWPKKDGSGYVVQVVKKDGECMSCEFKRDGSMIGKPKEDKDKKISGKLYITNNEGEIYNAVKKSNRSFRHPFASEYVPGDKNLNYELDKKLNFANNLVNSLNYEMSRWTNLPKEHGIKYKRRSDESLKFAEAKRAVKAMGFFRGNDLTKAMKEVRGDITSSEAARELSNSNAVLYKKLKDVRIKYGSGKIKEKLGKELDEFDVSGLNVNDGDFKKAVREIVNTGNYGLISSFGNNLKTKGKPDELEYLAEHLLPRLDESFKVELNNGISEAKMNRQKINEGNDIEGNININRSGTSLKRSVGMSEKDKNTEKGLNMTTQRVKRVAKKLTNKNSSKTEKNRKYFEKRDKFIQSFGAAPNQDKNNGIGRGRT